jgi:hypothetical protein
MANSVADYELEQPEPEQKHHVSPAQAPTAPVPTLVFNIVLLKNGHILKHLSTSFHLV